MSKQQDIPDLIAGALGVSRGTAYDLMREALAEQPAQQCWKCGDMDAAFQAKCTVPACGMKEQP